MSFTFEGRESILAVTFTDLELISKGLKPPFDSEHGEYEPPHLTMAAWEMRGDIPEILDGGLTLTYTIYSSWVDRVQNWPDFSGPEAGDNDVIAQALRNAEQMADHIACEADYSKTVRLIWKGWSCRPGKNGFIASAAVEVEIVCGT